MLTYYPDIKLRGRLLKTTCIFLLFVASLQAQTKLKVKVINSNEDLIPNVTVIGPKIQYKIVSGTSEINLGATSAKLSSIIDNLKFVKKGYQTESVEYFEKENELLVRLGEAPVEPSKPILNNLSKSTPQVKKLGGPETNTLGLDLEQSIESVTNQVRSEQKLLDATNSVILIEIKGILKKLENEKSLSSSEKKKLRINLERLTKVLNLRDKKFYNYKGQSDILLEKLGILLLEKDSLNKLSQRKIQQLEKEKQLEKEASNRNLVYVSSIAIFLTAIVILLAFLMRKVTNQRSILQAQNAEILAQKERIQTVYKELSDNIISAKVIQNAILPGKELMKKVLPKLSVFFQPKNVVSGDFYWFYQNGNKTMLAVADCTGHGVAGAFMSFLGYEILNEIVRDYKDLEAGKVLTLLNTKVLKALNTYGSTQVNSGMDISLCIIDHNSSSMEFAGANNPLYILRKGMTEIEQHAADRQGIGGRQKTPDFQFKTNVIPFSKEDSFMIFSDGYADQVGGENNNKFMYPRFRRLFATIGPKEPEAREKLLETQFNNWKGKEEQLDDVLVICFTL